MHLFATISPATTRPFATTQARLRFSVLALCLLASLGSSLMPTRADEPRIALAGSASPASALREAHLMGRLDAGTSLRVGLVLPLRHQDQLLDLIRRQYTPGDTLFHHFLTPADFTARFGPTAEDYAAVAAYARAQGLTITATSPGRTLLNVAGPSARIEAAFGVQMNRYRLPGGRLVFSNTAAPRLPYSVAVRLAGIAGLSNAALMRPHLSRMTPQHLVGVSQSGLRSNAPVPITGGGGTGSGPLGGLSPNDIKFAYGLSAITPLYGPSTTTPTSTGTLDGAGQNIGLFELDGYLPADIAAYVTQFALPTVTTGTTASVTAIPLGGFSGKPLTTTDQEGQTEVTLDIDMALALAPAATGVYVYEEDPSTDATAPLTIFTRMANDLNPNGTGKPLVQVISCSWGITESLEDPAIVSGEDTLFQQMAAQGQSVFCSSGDNGAYDLYTPTTTTTTTTTVTPVVTAPAVDNPASQPFATGVGGTTLSYVKPSTNAATGAVTPGAYVGEIVWSAGTPTVSPEGSGGGVSSLWAKPGYQQGFGSSPNRRDVPDVSLNADPNSGYSIFVTLASGSATLVEGGTSAAAPLWAAYTALVNQQRAANGQTSVGFLNPLLYSIAAGTSYATDFHDIVSGTNLFYSAGTGYDDASGLGSFVGASLLASLSSGAEQSTGAATLSGTVTDIASPTTPIAGATVSATTATTGAVPITTTTDATGSYTLTVPSGIALTVTVSTTGITSPTTTNYLGQTVTVPALAAGGSTPLSFELSAAVNYSAGLQMISAPFDYSGIGDFAAVFGLTQQQASLSPRLVQYSPLLNSYVFYPTSPADTLRLGQGYWVRFPSTNYLHIAGTPALLTQPFTLSLRQGWNQIGDPFPSAAPLSGITVTSATGTTGPLASTPAIVKSTLYDYNTATNAYATLDPAADSLQPYVGYWIYAFQSCTLSVPVPGPPAGPGF